MYLGTQRSTVRRHLAKAGISGNVIAFAGGSDEGYVEETRALPRKGVKRYVLSCAQSNTYVQDDMWASLQSLVAYYKAELLISRFTYNKNGYLRRTGNQSQKPGDWDENSGIPGATNDENWYDPRIVPFTCDSRVELAPGLLFCGELNILPTAVKPLSGLEAHLGRKSLIVPHVKLAMESIASSSNTEPAKFNYTTGTVTKKNYIKRKEGQKAEFHHCYGALLVEVCANGDWYVRQLNADRKGRIYDIGNRDDGCILADGKRVTTGHRAEAINWGDIHVAEALYDKDVLDLNWGKGGMLDTLKPKYQFGHDTFSFMSRNHHDNDDAHRNFEKWLNNEDNVEKELCQTAAFVNERMVRDWCSVVIVDSNHDRALQKWLNSTKYSYKRDPQNAEVFLELEQRKYRSLRERDETFHLLEFALRTRGIDSNVRFLREDESFVICRDVGGGIESGAHGHLGVNGARPAPLQLSKLGRRQNTGHTHSCCIIDGLYVAGVTARPKRFPYRKGPSSWSQTDIVTFANGKRQLITKWGGKYRAA